MCVHARTAVQGDSQRLNKVWTLFLKGKKLLKGSAMLPSWQHCASPFLQLRVPNANQGPHGSNRKYALRYIYIYIYREREREREMLATFQLNLLIFLI